MINCKINLHKKRTNRYIFLIFLISEVNVFLFNKIKLLKRRVLQSSDQNYLR